LNFSYENGLVVWEGSVQVASPVFSTLSRIKGIEVVLCNNASISSLPGYDMNCSDAECVVGVGESYRHISVTPRLFAAPVHPPSSHAAKCLILAIPNLITPDP